MKSLVQYKEQAILLRKKGLSYREILEKIPVAKSTLSLWLQEFPLNKQEKALMKRRVDGNISRGRIRAAASLHILKEKRDALVFEKSKKEFERYKTDPFFQLGLALYWAEGAKRATMFSFINTDPEMIVLLVRWIRTFMDTEEEEIRLRLFTHLPFKNSGQEEFWSQKTGIPLKRFGKTVYKKAGSLSKKRPNYNGCLRIELGKVQHFRKVTFWQKMLIEYYGK